MVSVSSLGSSLCVCLLLAVCININAFFGPGSGPHSCSTGIRRIRVQQANRGGSNANGKGLYMLFDFIKARSSEGFAQVQNIAKKTVVGKFGEALSETGDYVKMRNRIDAENLKKLTSGLSRSRDQLLNGIGGAFDKKGGIEETLFALEEVLLAADLGSSATNTIISDLRQYSLKNSLTQEDILPVLQNRLIEALTPRNSSQASLLMSPNEDDPSVIFVIGANGMGKTTTIGKIAARLRNEGNLTVLLGACDTYRAAATEQLEVWAKRANASIEKPTDQERLDNSPVPVVKRTLERAKREGFDVVIIDTSGRLSNNFELTQQLIDMKKAIQAAIPSAPHETLLVVDGTVGRNAVDQAATWRKHVGITGLAVTKLDGTARGGFVVPVVRDLGLPIKLIGVGEKIDDLRDFQPEVFVNALLGNDVKQSEKLKSRARKMLQMKDEDDVGEGTWKVQGSKEMSITDRLQASYGIDGSGSSGGSGGQGGGGQVESGKESSRPKKVKTVSQKKLKKISKEKKNK